MPLFVRTTIFRIVLIALLSISGFAQDLPDKIDGYPIHKAAITLKGGGSAPSERPYLVVGTPTVSDVSLGGITLAILGNLEAAGYDGLVHRMSFREFRVNGIEVKVEDFNTPFKVNKRGPTILPAPATVFLPTSNVLNAAWKEITDSKEDWLVTGTVIVFGKFKKFGFSFKRAIPVKIDLTIKNPLLEFRKNSLS